MDTRDYFRRIVLEDCEKAELTGERTPESLDSPEFRAVIKAFEHEGTVYMYNSIRGNIFGPCKVIAGFTEKGKRIYMPNGKLLDTYRLTMPNKGTEQTDKSGER